MIKPITRSWRKKACCNIFLSQRHPRCKKCKRPFPGLNEHWEKYGYGVWAVELAGSGELIGRCGLFYIPETDETEVDYLLAKAHWGKGFASEAASEALRFAFENAQKTAIVGIVHPENLASQHVLEKIGMRFTRADNYFGMDCLRYEIVRSKALLTIFWVNCLPI